MYNINIIFKKSNYELYTHIVMLKFCLHIKIEKFKEYCMIYLVKAQICLKSSKNRFFYTIL